MQETVQLQATFRALADPSRRQIITLLSQGELRIADIASQFDCTRAAIKKHLSVLEEAQIIKSAPRGRERWNKLEPHTLKNAVQWLNQFEQFWDDRLAALKREVELAEINNGDDST